jgi:hypothetical protein
MMEACSGGGSGVLLPIDLVRAWYNALCRSNEQFLFIFEVEVDCSFADASLFGDFFQIGLVQAAASEDAQGRIEDLVGSPLRSALPSGFVGTS